MHKLFLMLLVTGTAACAPAINQINANRYYEEGLRAESQQNWAQAREMYSRALINARSSGANPRYVSAATYNLGRMVGYTCDFPQAEALLMQSIELESALPNPDPANLTKRRSELARLTFDMGKFAESAQWYAQTVPALDQMKVADSDPIGFADYLDAYSVSKERSGQAAQAQQIRARASGLRSASAGKSAQFVPLQFRDVCAK